MKVVILADSLALPREEVGGDRCFEVTYPFLLHDLLVTRFGTSAPLIIERGMRLRTVEAVLTDWHEQVTLRHADVVVVHVGVVDCAPRVFLRRENAFLARRPTWIREPVLRFVHKHRRRIIQTRPRVYVGLDRFRRHIEEVTQKAQAARLESLVYINIVEPPQAIEERSPGFQRNVELYNKVLAQQSAHPRVSLIDLNRAIADAGGSDKLTLDGVHLNVQGHEILAKLLANDVGALCEGHEQSVLRSVTTI